MDHANVFGSLEKTRAYSLDPFREKCSALFEYLYESCPERDAGVYAVAA